MPVQVEREGRVLVIEIQREEKRNAIDPELTADFPGGVSVLNDPREAMGAALRIHDGIIAAAVTRAVMVGAAVALALLATLPQVDPRELHALGEALGTSDRVALAAFIDGIDRWIGEKLRTGDANANLPRLARLAEVWEKIIRAARDTESYHLERKPLVFSVFGMLAEATR